MLVVLIADAKRYKELRRGMDGEDNGQEIQSLRQAGRI